MVGGIVYSVVAVHTILTCQLGYGFFFYNDNIDGEPSELIFYEFYFWIFFFQNPRTV